MKKFILPFLLCFFTLAAQAQERILHFDAHANVRTDGGVFIVETITLNAEHDQIRRGIYRDIPLRAPQRLHVRGLAMDGKKHPYSVENFAGGVRINFGDDRFIPRGVHTYTFAYEMDNVIGFLKDYDEIYWNATGNNWLFPIDSARAQVVLPAQARVIEDKISFYTGRTGQKEQNAARNGLTFHTAAPLPPNAGLTVAVPFEKGAVHPSPELQNYTQKQKRNNFMFFLSLAALVLYGFWIWKRRGQDPAARVVRRFDAPEGVSPALARCLSRMGPDVKTTAVTLCSLSMKGLLEIKEIKTKFSRTYQITKKAVTAPPLPAEEEAAFNALPHTLTLNSNHNTQAEKLNEKVVKSLKAQCGKKYFRKNRWWTIPVWLLCAVLFVHLIFELGPQMVTPVVFIVFLVQFSFFTGGRKIKIIDGIMLGVFTLIFTPVLLQELPQVRAHWPAAAAFVLSLAGALWFTRIMRAYTPRGRKIMDEIDGYKEYLCVGEHTRVAASDPTDALKIFCDGLPYALALDADNQWIKTFSAVLGEAQVVRAAAARGYAAKGNFSASLSGMSASFAGAAAPRGSGRGGSGGGGFSGGGFGGGGGGGR